MSKHTKGPWQVRKSEYYYLVESEGYLIAKQERKADARLIAAAPELLRELKSAIFYIETYGGEVTSNFAAGENLNTIKTLIKKAEGES